MSERKNSRALSRDRLDDTLRRRPADRTPLCETTIWPETLDRWHAEGLPVDADVHDHFGLDRIACINDLFEPSFGLTPRTIEETPEQRVYVDGYGKTVREWRRGSHPPTIVAPALQTPAEWDRLRPRLADGEDRFNNPAAERDYEAARAAGDFIAITPAEPMWFVIYLTMGYEVGLRTVARNPGLVGEMIAAYTDYLLAMLERTLARGYRFDALWFWSDLCYRDGMLFSPRSARSLVLPHWQRLGEFAQAHDLRFIFHCDGYVGQLIPLLLEAGVHAIHPLEARAGNDVREYKRQYGDRLCLIGNINADVVATNDRAKIEAEVAAKVPAASAGGGYIYNIDHSVPPTVSLESYRWLLDCVRRHSQ